MGCDWNSRYMNKFFICSTSACMERMLDCQKVYSYLRINGWSPAKSVSKADLVIINTCAFGDYEDRSCVELIKHYTAQKKRSARVIIVGCLPVINRSKLEMIGEFPAIPPTNLDKLDEILKAKIKFREIAEPNRILSSEVSYKPSLKRILNAKSALIAFFSRNKTANSLFRERLKYVKRSIDFIFLAKAYINPFLVCKRESLFYLRISKGCMGNCSYCAKKFATGRLKSKPREQIINEFKKGLALKEKLFFLLTEDAGCYGLDIGATIMELLEGIFGTGKGCDYKLIISNFNAEWFLKYYNALEDMFVENQNNILYVHIPIQSGSNRILRLMNRPYRIEDVERSLLCLRDKIPALRLSTDIMVGFPGETEEDLNLSGEFLKKIKFDFADIFGYENRPNTPASKMSCRLPQETIESRRLCLLKIQNKNAKTATVVKKIAEVAGDFI